MQQLDIVGAIGRAYVAMALRTETSSPSLAAMGQPPIWSAAGVRAAAIW
jgi:hypothetical protein